LIVQLIGLPCSGKSTILKHAKKYFNITVIDKKDFFYESDMVDLLKSDDNIYVIESGQGLEIKSDCIVLLKVSKARWFKNIASRSDFDLSLFDINQFDYNAIAADYTIYNSSSFLKILKVLLPLKFRIKDIPNE